MMSVGVKYFQEPEAWIEQQSHNWVLIAARCYYEIKEISK